MTMSERANESLTIVDVYGGETLQDRPTIKCGSHLNLLGPEGETLYQICLVGDSLEVRAIDVSREHETQARILIRPEASNSVLLERMKFDHGN